MSFTFNEYQEQAWETASYPSKGEQLIYAALGIAEEGGEVAGKVKKLWRNHNITKGSDLAPEQREALVKEIGDVLWYAGALATELGVSLESVALTNIVKLRDRQLRGVIKSEGDNR